MRRAVVLLGLVAGVAGLAVGYLPAVKPVVVPEATSVLSGVSAADKAILREFYSAMADIVVRDGDAKEPACKSLFDLRNRHKFALSMAFTKTGMAGRYPGLGGRLDEYLLAAVGSQDLPLTAELRESAAKAFAAIK